MTYKKNHTPLLMIDFYKACHADQYPEGLTKLVSYLTPRTTRLELTDHLVNFGLQGFVKEYLCDAFEENFFKRSEEKVVTEYERVLDATLGHGLYDSEKVRALHRLGYLPLEIGEVPEGTRVPIHVPMLYITNTHPDFAWVVGTVESVMSAYLWHPMVCAEVGYQYRQIAKKWYDRTVDEGDADVRRAIGDFSFRGQESPEAAITSSAGWLLSNVNTATVPAILFMEDFYNADCQTEEVGFGAVSTEHSVMCSNYAVDENEKDLLVRLLTEVYKTGYFTCVLDSYDYFHVLHDILPEIKDVIVERDGCFAVRGDSGDPVGTLCETVQILWDIFGGHVNDKGYKVLDHVKAVWGDAITLQRAEEIFERLESMSFSAQNVSLGAGSFSMQSIQENGQLKPFTRDSFGIAIKTTFGEMDKRLPQYQDCVVCGNDGFEGFGRAPWEIDIFKDPKTDSGIKKSQKGMIRVFHDENSELAYQDGYSASTLAHAVNNGAEQVFEQIFVNGKVAREQTLEEIRQTLWDGKFYE